jgi:hypothetical protein
MQATMASPSASVEDRVLAQLEAAAQALSMAMAGQVDPRMWVEAGEEES